MFVVLRHAQLFTPDPLGPCDVLVANGQIAAIGTSLPALPAAFEVDELDCGGQRVIPGLIDPHVHVIGGGGEAGPASRVPRLTLRAAVAAGVTTVVGVLGTDGTTRCMADLVASVLGLREEGLSAWCYTGSYELPLRTLTASVRQDIVFIDPILGVGELAISDHRSSQPTFDELVRIAADCHVAGLASGKAGVLHLHLGDGPRGLELVRRALDETELPARVFYPTHVNRLRRLFDESMALTRRYGCTVDVTAFPLEDDDPGVTAAEAIETWLAAGLPASRLTCSTDAGGCLPTFDGDGNMLRYDVGRFDALLDTLRTLLARGLALEDVLPCFARSAADLLRLPQKGRVEVGADADLVGLNDDGEPSWVMVRGRFLMRDGVCRRGNFDDHQPRQPARASEGAAPSQEGGNS